MTLALTNRCCNRLGPANEFIGSIVLLIHRSIYTGPTADNGILGVILAGFA